MDASVRDISQGKYFIAPPGYSRHRPETTLLHQLVAEYYPSFRDRRAAEGRALPRHVDDEFAAYLKCGLLEHGFLRVKCDACQAEKLVVFSCKRRGFCPSCGARRMAETAVLLVDKVLPQQPVRQWVLSLPFAMHGLLGSSITYRIATGPREGQKVFTLQTPPTEPDAPRPEVAESSGFSLHAGLAAKPSQRDKLERLTRYVARPPVATGRLALTGSGHVRYTLKTPYRDGTTHVIFEPGDFIARLAALVPKPRAHLTRYHGVFAPASPDRARVVPKIRAAAGSEHYEASTTNRQRAMTWAQHLKRVFAIDIEICRRCGGRLHVIASIEVPAVIERILRYLGRLAFPGERGRFTDPTMSPGRGSACIATLNLPATPRLQHAATDSTESAPQKRRLILPIRSKTTLINIVCGIVTPSSGKITVDGHDNILEYQQARRKIGLVPQELHTDAFESVLDTVSFSRELFGCRRNPAFIERLLKDLSLWDKRKASISELSGGMKRRVMIAKALSHEPSILFLDEPSAGVDVELRRNMWAMVRALRDQGVTIILTTHYIEEAEEMADRVGVIANGKLLQVDDKATLMKRLGRKLLTLSLIEPLAAVPAELMHWNLTLAAEGNELVYEFDTQADSTGVPSLLRKMSDLGIGFKDLHTQQSSLEDIFVRLVNNDNRELL